VRTLRSAGPYALAYALFIAIGVAQPNFLLSWGWGIPFLVVVAWGVPALVNRATRAARSRRRRGGPRDAHEAILP
jgi:hypothetical protein